DDNTLPLRISDKVVLDRRIPIQDSALAYRTGDEGLAIAGGFVYRGARCPQLQGTVVFGDITSGRVFYARMWDLIAATDANPATMAPYSEIRTNLPDLVHERVPAPAAGAAPAGRAGGPAGRAMAPRPPRQELRLATDEAGEIYLLTKRDGVIRR